MKTYYIDLGYKDVRIGMYDAFDFDQDGIPRYPYPTGLFHNITFICHFALYHHTRYVKFRRPEDLAIFFHVCDWILAHGKESDSAFLFPIGFQYERLAPPWISALGQGRMLSVLTRAYDLSGEERYLRVAIKAMAPFEVAASDGGVRSRFPDGGIAFEEYPCPAPNVALNGLITSLVGLYDLGETGQAPRAAELYAQGVRSLENNLHRFDLGYWSAYDLTGYVASANYHQYHLMQLWELYEMTGIATFRQTATKWRHYRKGARFHAFYLITRGRKWIGARLG